MKNLSPILASAAFLIFSGSAIAATDTKTIDIEVVQGTYAELTGSAVDGNVKNVNMSNITANTTNSLGTLGVTSNGSNCGITFSTLNNFRLLHETSGVQLKRFRLQYESYDIVSNTDADANITLTSCVLPASALNFATFGEAPDVIEEGTYKDTVTITLTAE